MATGCATRTLQALHLSGALAVANRATGLETSRNTSRVTFLKENASISHTSQLILALRRLAAYVDRALLAAEEDVESASEPSDRYQRHRKYFRRRGNLRLSGSKPNRP